MRSNFVKATFITTKRMLIKNRFASGAYVAQNTNFVKKRVKKWLGREDSNLRMPAPKAGALPLGDAPKDSRLNVNLVNFPCAI